MLVESGFCHFQTWLLKISLEIFYAFSLTSSSDWIQWSQWKTLRSYEMMKSLDRRIPYSWKTKWSRVHLPLALFPPTSIALWHKRKINFIVFNLWVTAVTHLNNNFPSSSFGIHLASSGPYFRVFSQFIKFLRVLWEL